ncbi:hypothetical protein AZOA_07280 [Azoarcus sp. Aa7]|nr:hypothetical protein [Azoarcus sp. Aa7]
MATSKDSIFIAHPAQQPALEPKVVIHFAGIDSNQLTDRIDVLDAITRRLGQVSAINELLGHAYKLVGEVSDNAFSGAAWAARDLVDETKALANMLANMPD